MSLVIEELDDRTVERAAELVAAEHAAARRARPELPPGFVDPAFCGTELHRLLAAGQHGVVVTDGPRPVAVMTAVERESPVVGRYALMPAGGFAVDPRLDDPTPVLVRTYAELAAPFVAGGVRQHYLLHVALPRLAEGLANLGFGRDAVYAVRPVAEVVDPAPADVTVRVDGDEDLDAVAGLALVELHHRAAPPMFARIDERSRADLAAEHRRLREGGAVHLLASVDGRDAGLLTLEPNTPAPRLCAAGQPYIGPTATHPEFRHRGVGRSLVAAAVEWARERGHDSLGVDFASANPLSRPFWLGAGFRPTGYGLWRVAG